MPPFDPNQTIEEEAGLPEGWHAVDVAPISPGAPPAQSPNTRGTYYSAAIDPTMQHDATLVGSKYSGRTPQNALMPLPSSGQPTVNSTVRSGIVAAAPAAPVTPATIIGGVHLLTASYTATSGDYSKLLSFNAAGSGMPAPTVRNFGSSPSGNGDSTFGPGNNALTAPGTSLPTNTWTAFTGDTIVVLVVAGTVTGVTDNVPGSPNVYASAGTGMGGSWWIAKNITGGTNFQVTVTISAPTTYPIAYVWDIQGASLTAPFEQQVSASGGSPATPTVAITTINPNDLILAGIGITATSSAGAKVTAGGAFTLDTNYSNFSSSTNAFVPSANNGTTPYGGAEHVGVTGIFSGNVQMPISTGAGSYSAWTLYAAAITSGSGPILTLPANPPSSFWYIAVENTGTIKLEVNPNGKNLDGSSANLDVPAGQGLFIFTDGFNYYTERGMGSGGGGSVASVDLTAQAANVAATTAYAVPTSGLYRVSVYMIVSQAASSSSTLPDSRIIFTDEDSSATITIPVTSALSTNTTSTFVQASYIVNAKTGTNLQYDIGQVTAYASSGGTPMQFAYRLRVEAL